MNMMKRNSGQAAVFVLLVMLLGLTVGLSVMSRTLQDLKSTTTSDQSSRAFSAAEAGIETALANLTLGDGPPTVINGVTVNYNVAATAGTYTATIPKDEVGQIELTSPAEVIVSWTNNAALELNFYTYNAGSETYGLTKYALNPYGETIDNSFSASNPGPAGYKSTKTIPAVADSKLLRIKPIYNSTTIQVTGVFPAQNYTITSTGSTTDGVTRSVRVDKSKPALPPLFDYVLFGGTGNVVQ